MKKCQGEKCGGGWVGGQGEVGIFIEKISHLTLTYWFCGRFPRIFHLTWSVIIRRVFARAEIRDSGHDPEHLGINMWLASPVISHAHTYIQGLLVWLTHTHVEVFPVFRPVSVFSRYGTRHHHHNNLPIWIYVRPDLISRRCSAHARVRICIIYVCMCVFIVRMWSGWGSWPFCSQAKFFIIFCWPICLKYLLQFAW